MFSKLRLWFKRRSEHQLNVPMACSEPLEKKTCQTSVQSRLSQLQKLTQELMTTPESIMDCINEAGEDVINAVMELGRAFTRAKCQSVCTALQSSTSAKPGSFQLLNPSAALPKLPLIKDRSLEVAVFTHQGTVSRQSTSSTELSYDRLEILGDAYIEVIATRLIWDHFRSLPPGRISQIREMLVKNETLAQYAT